MEVAGCYLPEDRLYDFEESTWSVPGPDASGWALGLTASIVAFAGPIRSLTFRPLEGEQPRGRSVATVESQRYTGPVRLPAAGTLLATNAALTQRPRILNDSPYELGWIVRWSPRDPEALRRQLEGAAAIRERLAERIRELGIRCFTVTPDRDLIEIGAECAAILVRLDEELARMAPGEVLHLVTDDPTSPIEMVRWSDRSGHPVVEHRAEANLHHFLVRREAAPRPKRRSAADGRLL